jgi:hypothetical protein
VNVPGIEDGGFEPTWMKDSVQVHISTRPGTGVQKYSDTNAKSIPSLESTTTSDKGDLEMCTRTIWDTFMRCEAMNKFYVIKKQKLEKIKKFFEKKKKKESLFFLLLTAETDILGR